MDKSIPSRVPPLPMVFLIKKVGPIPDTLAFPPISPRIKRHFLGDADFHGPRSWEDPSPHIHSLQARVNKLFNRLDPVFDLRLTHVVDWKLHFVLFARFHGLHDLGCQLVWDALFLRWWVCGCTKLWLHLLLWLWWWPQFLLWGWLR